MDLLPTVTVWVTGPIDSVSRGRGRTEGNQEANRQDSGNKQLTYGDITSFQVYSLTIVRVSVMKSKNPLVGGGLTLRTLVIGRKLAPT